MRGKTGSILAAFAWVVIIASLSHSLKHYKPRPAGLFSRITSFHRDCPMKLLINILLLGIRIGYGIASAWVWDLSIFQDEVAIGWPFGLGYGSILLIIVIFNIAGFFEENEDKVLIKQRLARGQIHDAELNIVKKPTWWSRAMGNRFASDDDRLRDMANIAGEVSAGRPTERRPTQTIEMGNMNIRQRSSSRPPDDPFRDESPHGGRGDGTGAQRPVVSRLQSDRASVRTDLTGQTLTQANINSAAIPQQTVRSMLDV